MDERWIVGILFFSALSLLQGLLPVALDGSDTSEHDTHAFPNEHQLLFHLGIKGMIYGAVSLTHLSS
jgi:hypothetical protein